MIVTKIALPRRTFLRGVDYTDAPAVRQIVRDAARDDYRFTSLILAVTRSAPFTMRRAE